MELYDITFAGQTFRFTSYGEDITVNGLYYQAIPISRNEIDVSLEANGLVFTAPISVDPFRLFVSNPTIKLARIVITKYPELYKIFEGNIIKSEYDYDKREVKITLGSKFYLTEAEVPKRTYSRTCSFDFCGEGCGLDKSNYSFILPEGSFTYSGFEIKSNLIPTISFFCDGGYIETDKQEYQFIVKKDNDIIYLIRPLVYEPKQITVIGSCDKTLAMCKQYGNEQNFGGFPYIPQKNLYSEGF